MSGSSLWRFRYLPISLYYLMIEHLIDELGITYDNLSLDYTHDNSHYDSGIGFPRFPYYKVLKYIIKH